MANDIWGLDLGAWSLKIVRGYADKGGGITVDLCDEVRYHTLEGVGDDTDRFEKIEAALDEFASRHTVAAGDDLCVTVSGNEVFSRFINLPPVPESISEIIQYEARQQIPFDMEKVVWDYQPLKEEHQPGEEIEVGLFALKRATVDELMVLLEPWRRNLRIIQNAPLAVYNFLSYEGYVGEPVIVLDMGAATTDVLVLNHPRFWLRSLLVGGNAFTEQVQNHFGVSFTEAERVKERASETGRAAQLMRVVKRVTGKLVNEVQRSLGYYKSLSPDVRFTKIFGLGGAFKLGGLDRVIAEGLQYNVEVINKVNNFNLAPTVDEDEFIAQLGGFCPALGLLAQDSGYGCVRINLVPEQVAMENEIRKKKPYIIVAVAALYVIGLVLLLGEMAYGRTLGGNVGKGESVVGEIDALNEEYSSIHRKVRDIQQKLESYVERNIDRDIYLQIVPAIAQMLPQDVYVESMNLEWVPEKDVDEMIEADKETKKEGGDRVRPGRPSSEDGLRRPGVPPGVMPMEGPMPEGPPALIGGGRDVSKSAMAGVGKDSVILLDFTGESMVVGRGMSHIQQNVINPLKELRFEASGHRMFKSVYLMGAPRIILRNARTGKLLEGGRNSEEEYMQFVRFRLLAKVNVEDEPLDETEQVDNR